VKIILQCDPEHLDDAVAVLRGQLKHFGDYDRVGYGWAFGREPRFFVSRIKEGLSVKQIGMRRGSLPVAPAGGQEAGR